MHLSTAYFAPIEWYAAFLADESPVIDIHEHYRKQTWRNRCRIVGPNGVQDLIVPVHLDGNHTPVKNVRIDYSDRWQQRHWGAIRSAYGQSPFFEHFAPSFEVFFQTQEYTTLVELNTAILETILRLLRVKKNWNYSEEFLPYAERDLRLILSPKHASRIAQPPSYVQVFAERHGFLPNLSILDLLFCEGNAAAGYLAGYPRSA